MCFGGNKKVCFHNCRKMSLSLFTITVLPCAVKTPTLYLLPQSFAEDPIYCCCLLRLWVWAVMFPTVDSGYLFISDHSTYSQFP